MPAITIINSIPRFITPEEHTIRTGSTPASFSDIPPVLRHKEDNVRVSLDPPITELSEEELSKGTLYVVESTLAYISSSTGRGFQVEYPSIILHAVSRDAHSPHIYCQLADQTVDSGLPATNGSNGSNGAVNGAVGAEHQDDVDEEDISDMRELQIVPEGSTSLEPIFEALSQCAALHPDPDQSDDELGVGMGMGGDDDDDAFVDADVEAVQAIAHTVGDEPELSEAGREVLARLDALILDPHGHLASSEEGNEDGDNEQFEDAQDLCTDTDAKVEKEEKDTPSDE